MKCFSHPAIHIPLGEDTPDHREWVGEVAVLVEVTRKRGPGVGMRDLNGGLLGAPVEPLSAQHLLGVAREDFPTLWAHLEWSDHLLSKALTANKESDAAFVRGGYVWQVIKNHETKCFDLKQLGPESELCVYVGPASTGLTEEEDLDELIDRLEFEWANIPGGRAQVGLRIVKGDCPTGGFAAQWVMENEYVRKVWNKELAFFFEDLG